MTTFTQLKEFGFSFPLYLVDVKIKKVQETSLKDVTFPVTASHKNFSAR